MKKFEIFRPGRHTAASGATIEFTAADMRAASAAYDPAAHEAPIVVGHPKDNGPAYGWVGGLSFGESGALEADPVQVDAEFAEMVSSGRFKKRSASWYTPGSANHPLAGTDRHGTYYLRHVGFLGAQPPAVKGLKEIAFVEAEDGVVEFDESSSWAWSAVASLARGIREWIIGEKGAEAADKIVPNYVIEDIARKASGSATQDIAGSMPAYNEDDAMSTELHERVAALTAENEALKANQRPVNFAETEAALSAREAALAARETTIARAAVESRLTACVTAGRLVPAALKQSVSFSMGLSDADASVEFGEGATVRHVTQREAYLLQIEAAPKVVDYQERAGDTGAGAGGSVDPAQLAARARGIQSRRAADGLAAVSYTEAVALAVVDISNGVA